MLETRCDRNKLAVLVYRDWQRHHPHCPPLPGGGAPTEASAAPLVGPGVLSATSFLPFDLSVFNVSLLLFPYPTCSPQESLAPSQVRAHKTGRLFEKKQTNEDMGSAFQIMSICLWQVLQHCWPKEK